MKPPILSLTIWVVCVIFVNEKEGTTSSPNTVTHIALMIAPKNPTPPPILVMLVEDMPEYRQLYGDILRRAGYTVLTTTHGQQALDIIEHTEDHISVIITDNNFIGHSMTGIDLISILKNKMDAGEMGQIPIGLMSGFEISPDKHRADRFVTKPIGSAQLISMVQELLTKQPLTAA